MQFYRQSTPYTGAASSLLMALHAIEPDRFPLNRDEEFLIWRESVTLPTRSSSIFGLASYAQKQGIDAKIIAENLEYNYPDYRFKRYKKIEIEDAGYMSELHAREAQKEGVTISEELITLELINALLGDKKYLLLRVNAGVLRDQKATSKYVLLYGQDENHHYLVMDPEQGQLAISHDDLAEAIDTLKTKKKRESRLLVLT